MSSTSTRRMDRPHSTVVHPPANAEETSSLETQPEAIEDPVVSDSGSNEVSWSVSPLRWAVLAVVVLLPIILIFYWVRGFGGIDKSYVFYKLKRSDLPIVVTERGTLQSQENIEILCEVDEVRGDGIDGTPITWLIDNGASVKKGDLIVELANGSHQSELDQQILDTEEALSKQIQAKAKYENQITQNETTLANAELEVTLADLELKMFSDRENGTHQLEVEEIKRLIDDINNEILAAQASMELTKNDKEGIETLFKLGYAGKSEVDRSRLDFLQAESQYASKMNKLTTQLAALKKKQTYEQQMQLLTLAGKQETAKRNRDQVERDNEALLEQAKAAWDAAERSLEKERERLEKRKQQVANCKIYAPQDGMVTYAVSDPKRWWQGEVRVGGTVRPRQHIMSIPNLKKMEVSTAINESILDRVKPEQTATVRIEAVPDGTYGAQVEVISVMANRQASEVKDYTTIVTLDGEVSGLKPGMTAIVDIHVAHLKNILAIPVQAIVEDAETTFCYVRQGRSVTKRVLELGRTNDKFVEITGGLSEGDDVLLNPMAVVNESSESKPITPDTSSDVAAS